ncbi:MAG: SRPBCC domain-containing protein [Thermoplasmata archaeon]
MTREIEAKPREVFAAWIDPKHPGTPWSKRHGIRRAIVNPFVGGLFYINMGPPMPLAIHFGRFLRLDRPKLIEHTWASEGTLGAETLVRITLRAKGEGTLFSLRHTGLPNRESARGHEEGWGWIVGWLADGLSARRC